MSKLFSPITIRGEKIPNRVFVSPLCQGSSETEDGRRTSWHPLHYGTWAFAGIGYVPQGREVFPYLNVQENMLMNLEALP